MMLMFGKVADPAAEKHEIYVATFGCHFYDLFLQSMAPLPLLDRLLRWQNIFRNSTFV